MRTYLAAFFVMAIVVHLAAVGAADNDKEQKKEKEKEKKPKKQHAEIKGTTDQKKTLAATMSGQFDFKQNPRPYAVALILDQEGNRWPSFWAGKNLEGQPKMTAKFDHLTQNLQLEQQGAFTLQIFHAAHKRGMHDKLPCGAWIENLGERKFHITVEKVVNAKVIGTRKGALLVDTSMGSAGGDDTNLVHVEAQFEGKASIDGISAKISGPIALNFSDGVPMFGLHATFALPADQLGLGEAGKGIQATLYTTSAPAKALGASPNDLDSMLDKNLGLEP